MLGSSVLKPDLGRQEQESMSDLGRQEQEVCQGDWKSGPSASTHNELEIYTLRALAIHNRSLMKFLVEGIFHTLKFYSLSATFFYQKCK